MLGREARAMKAAYNDDRCQPCLMAMLQAADNGDTLCTQTTPLAANLAPGVQCGSQMGCSPVSDRSVRGCGLLISLPVILLP